MWISRDVTNPTPEAHFTGRANLTKPAFKDMKQHAINRRTIRSTGLARLNHLTRAARHLPELLAAFAEWTAGEIYICRKTGTYRYRFGDRSKSIAPWSKLARELFPTVADFAFAASVFHQDEPLSAACETAAPSTRAAAGTRVNVLSIAA